MTSNHPGGVHVTMGDGAVILVTDQTELVTVKQIASKDDGNVLKETCPKR